MTCRSRFEGAQSNAFVRDGRAGPDTRLVPPLTGARAREFMDLLLRIDDETTAEVSVFLDHSATFSTGVGDWLHAFDNEGRAPSVHTFDFFVDDSSVFLHPVDTRENEAVVRAVDVALARLKEVPGSHLKTEGDVDVTLIARFQVDEYPARLFDGIRQEWSWIFDACSGSPHEIHGALLEELVDNFDEEADTFGQGSFFYIHGLTTHPALDQNDLLLAALLVLLKRLGRMGAGIVMADPGRCHRIVLGAEPAYGDPELDPVLRDLGFHVPNTPTDPETARYRLVDDEVFPRPQLVSGGRSEGVRSQWSVRA